MRRRALTAPACRFLNAMLHLKLTKKYSARVLACGSHRKNTVCYVNGDDAVVSDVHGDCDDARDAAGFRAAADRLRGLYGAPGVIAYDLHPEYLPTQYALATNGTAKAGVQHHHAHIAACMADNGIDEEVIGVACDGLGYGADGKLWGGEFFVGGYAGMRRVATIRDIMLPGGAAAIREPWRTAAALLYDAFDGDISRSGIRAPGKIGTRAIGPVVEMIEKEINTPTASSMGRLFDGISALTGVRAVASYEGEAAIELEKAAASGVIAEVDGRITFDWRPVVRGVVKDIASRRAVSEVAALFHNTIAAAVAAICARIRDRHGDRRVVCAGGVFQNRYLTRKIEELCGKERLRLIFHKSLPQNDSSVSLGQAMIALHLHVSR